MLNFGVSRGHRRDMREVAMIVLGVVIALGLGAIATEIGWRLEVREARAAVRSELAFNFELLERGRDHADCIDRRLETLARIVEEASQTRRLPPLGAIHGTGGAIWQRGVWDSQVAAETAAHYPTQEAAGLSRIYRRFQLLIDNNARMDEAWTTLQGMSGPGRSLDPVTEGALYDALSRARRANDFVRLSAPFTRNILANTLGVDYPRFADDRRPITAGVASACSAAVSDYRPPTYGSPVYSPAEQAQRMRDLAGAGRPR